MSVFWLLLLFGILARIVVSGKAHPEPLLPIKERSCPPHSWISMDQPGMEGVSYTQCSICKMIPNGGRE